MFTSTFVLFGVLSTLFSSCATAKSSKWGTLSMSDTMGSLITVLVAIRICLAAGPTTSLVPVGSTEWPSVWPFILSRPAEDLFFDDTRVGLKTVKLVFNNAPHGPTCRWHGQQRIFEAALRAMFSAWPQTPPRDHILHQPEREFDPVLSLEVELFTNLFIPPGSHSAWELLRRVLVGWIAGEFSNRGCRSSTVGIQLVWNDNRRPETLGYVRVDIKPPPAFDPQKTWPPFERFPFSEGIDNQPPEHTGLEFLDSRGAEVAWPSGDGRDRFRVQPWTDPDPVRRRFMVRMIREALGTIARKPGQVVDQHGDFYLDGWTIRREPDIWLEFAKHELYRPGTAAQSRWTKNFTLDILKTLARLVAERGVISCVVNIWKHDENVGQVWLGANTMGHPRPQTIDARG